MDIESAQNVMRQAILSAGQLLMDYFVRPLKVDIKNNNQIDLVTEADKKAEKVIITSIQKQFPDHSILSEEDGSKNNSSPYCWIIDPLDGTVNFTHSLPIFTISIALHKDNQPIMGMIYDPSRQELFEAIKGNGAKLNHNPIKVSNAQTIGKSLLCTGFPYDRRQNPDNNHDLFVHFNMLSRGVRRLGSAALDLCYVACGRWDGFWEKRLKIWDLAAGSLIVEEAGGKVTDLNGDNLYIQSGDILAANPIMHQQMLVEIHPNNQSETKTNYLSGDH